MVETDFSGFVPEVEAIFGKLQEVVSAEKLSAPYLESCVIEGGGGCTTQEEKCTHWMEGFRHTRTDENGKIHRIAEPVTLDGELKKASLCDHFLVEFTGSKTGAPYFKCIHCGRWFCAKCGSHKGRIHRRRITSVVEALGGKESLSKQVLRQFVFTIPESERERFITRKNINSLAKMAEGVMKKFFPGGRIVCYVHLTGDKHSYNPHINFHIFEEYQGQTLKLSQETMGAILANWNYRLKKYGCEDLAERFDYSFIRGLEKIIHRIKYMTKLRPGYEDFESIKDNEEMLYFYIIEMKKFMFVRYLGDLAANKEGIQDSCIASEVEEHEERIGEELLFVRSGVSWKEFREKYSKRECTVLDDGFYRVERTMTE